MDPAAQISGQSHYWLRDVTLPVCLCPDALISADADGLARGAVLVEDGRIAHIAHRASDDAPVIPLDGGMAFPCFTDMHTHLDKGHIWPRGRNVDGSFESALENTHADRTAHWSAEDVAARMDFALRCAYAHGTSLVRTHLDSIAPQHAISWPVFDEMRRKWAGRIELQAVSLFPIDQALDDHFLDEIATMASHCGGVLGAVTFMIPDLDDGLDRVFRKAMELGLDLDFHVDESQDTAARSLRHIANMALHHHYEGRIVCGHCCSLARQPEDEMADTIGRVAEAGIAIVSLPMCNLYLQDRHAGRTPRSRGITVLHELKAAGVEVAVASDNTRDPFYAYGDLDMLEVLRAAVRIGHLDHPFADWPRLASAAPAAIIGRSDHGQIASGASADLVLFRARTWTELLSRPQSDRTVLRAGQPIATELPDYRELDHLFAR